MSEGQPKKGNLAHSFYEYPGVKENNLEVL